MIGLTYTLQLLEPVLANSLAGDTNSARSLLYIPGSLVRGALIHFYRQGKPAVELNSDNEKFRRLFLNGETCYLHAYPFNHAETRTLPAPLAWKTHKDETAGSENMAVTLFNLSASEPDDKDIEDLKAPDLSGWWQEGETAYSREAAHQINVHTQRDAVWGRARTAAGAVFRYEALPAGLQLQGVILTSSQADATELTDLLTGRELLLGKARTAGYGRARVESVTALPASWQEGWDWSPEAADHDQDDEPPASDTPTTTQRFTLTLLSAALVRDERGQFSLDIVPALEARWQTQVRAAHIFRAGEIVGGFDRMWGLPRVQVTAVAPGSVFVIETDTPVPLARLEELEATGLGERRAEGFGRVTIDLKQPAEIQWTKRTAENVQTTFDARLSPISQQMAEAMLTRLLRRKLDRQLLSVARGYQVMGQIPNSQLSRWRVIARSAMLDRRLAPEEKLERLTKFYAAERDKRSRAWQKMERARFKRPDNKRVTEWIDAVLTDQHSPWNWLELGDESPREKLGDTAEVIADEKLAVEYKLRLIDAVLAVVQEGPQGPDGGHDA